LPKTQQNYEHVERMDRQTEVSTSEDETNIIKNTPCKATTM